MQEESAVELVGPGPHWLTNVQFASARENGDHVIITLKVLHEGRELRPVSVQLAWTAADRLLQELAQAVAKTAKHR